MINTVKLSDLILCIIVEKEDEAVTSFYLQKFYTYTNLKPDNIKIVSRTKIPQSLSEFDLIIVDIDIFDNILQSSIDQISLNGDIVIFTSQDLGTEMRERLKDKVTLFFGIQAPSFTTAFVDFQYIPLSSLMAHHHS